jgi:dienelactone hydrolase
MKFKMLAGLACVVMMAVASWGKVQTQVIEYRDGDVVLEGYLAWDDAVQGPRPGVLVVHQWKGLGDYEKRRARELAGLGYAAFAVDMYGKGVRPESNEEAGKLAGMFKNDRALTRTRATAGLKVLTSNQRTAGQPVAAMGYCFGGMVALELARSGAPVAGTVSFHGTLDTPEPKDAAHIRGKVLVLHGADDPHVPPPQVEAFQKEMRDAGVDWQFVAYGGAVHAFTDSGAGNDPSLGAAYNANADRRSWQAMKDFFDEVLKRN